MLPIERGMGEQLRELIERSKVDAVHNSAGTGRLDTAYELVYEVYSTGPRTSTA